MGRVIVIGSINQDITVTVDRFPSPGETLSGSSVAYRLGGKGANQASAAARSGATTHFVGSVGAGANGDELIHALASHGVDTTLVDREGASAGIAFITVASSGENTIILDAGANRCVSLDRARTDLHVESDDVVVLQAEIPQIMNDEALTWAHEAGARVICNIAPARATSPSFLANLDILVVNESEAGIIAGIPSPSSPDQARNVAHALLERGPSVVLITLGAQGVIWASGEDTHHLPAFTASQVVDTTGAGDASVGAFAAALALGWDLPQAVEAAMRAGCAAVGGVGAADSYARLPRLTQE